MHIIYRIGATGSRPRVSGPTVSGPKMRRPNGGNAQFSDVFGATQLNEAIIFLSEV